jgi:hypothetical protein
MTLVLMPNLADRLTAFVERELNAPAEILRSRLRLEQPVVKR